MRRCLDHLGRKGSLPDVLYFPIKMLVGAVLLVIVGYMMLQFGNKLEGTPLQQTEVGNKSITFFQTVGENNIPTYFTVLFSFDIIGILGTSYLITLGPVFFILYVIFVGFAVALSVFSMVFYDKFSEVAHISSYVSSQTLINYIIQYAPIISLIVGALSAIIIMAKLPGQNSQDI